jgi:hypothetical protein
MGIARVGEEKWRELVDEEGRGWWGRGKGSRRLREREGRWKRGRKWGTLDLVAGT